MYPVLNYEKASATIRGKAFLTALIAVTLGTLVRILSAHIYVSTLGALMMMAFEEAISFVRIPDGMRYIMDLLSGTESSFLLTIVTQIPTIVFAVGLWLVWLAARNPAAAGNKAETGSVLIRIYMTIQYVFRIVVFAASVLFAIGMPMLLGAALRNIEQYPWVTGEIRHRYELLNYVILAGLILMACCGVRLWFWRTARKAAAEVSGMLNGGEAPLARRLFVILCYVLGVLGCIAALVYAEIPLAAVSAAASAAAWIVFGIFLSQVTKNTSSSAAQ